ncbi:Xaa-Pro aminopeptidase [Pseudidiomarina salinarum]|uniref:Xaa-Pro aminopeptidase n=1 Tax=Pseudidiomarina salinarum TaxID=435908 RepID=A0A094L611_9GAMM|nr:M24 family metallopeptidase [Pseudidiomarina salinarum]KFZ30163.1 Xaa-Pro aminopeptidase [Pseudidiomarina salinarum]RUO68664.1 Xaa-Pro aminopeptidase [Pseudidiomarina salinarum]
MSALRVIFLLSLLATVTPAVAEPLPLAERAEVVDEILQERINNLLPQLMRDTDIDMWVLISREYNEDPVLRTMLPSDWFSARRRTILVLFDRGIVDGTDRGVEALAVARYDVGDIFKKAWDPEQQPDQWQRLAAIINERNPQRIGINQSDYFAQADGLVATDKEQLMQNLPAAMQQRVVSAEKLAIRWLETRIPGEIPHYRNAVGIAQQIIADGFSDAVVTPGITTTTDIEWWMQERIAELKLSAWFPPTVTLQRKGEANSRMADAIVQPGDLLHVDLGITYLRLNTDTQQHAYVLRQGEQAAPASLQQALSNGNRVQDYLTDEFAVGRTGNEIFLAALEKAKAAGLQPSIYTHPIGYYGHGSGPTIGMWDKQQAIPVTGDYPMYANTAYSIELNNRTFSDDWQQDVMIMLEEDTIFDGKQVDYLHGRQQEFHLIRE